MEDYIDRRFRRLDADRRFWEHRYRRALSRTWVLRDRLAHLPITRLDGIEGITSAASALSTMADRAARLRRRADDTRKQLAAFDPERQRQENMDIDGHCRYLDLDGVCGRPTVDGSRWCARHADLWCDHSPDGGHVVGLWRAVWLEHTTDGAFARLTMCSRVSAQQLRETVACSKAVLDAEPYETDDLCTPVEIIRWTTIPDEYEPKKDTSC